MTPAAIAALLAKRSGITITAEQAQRLALYLDLLLRWNARMNLSAIRTPEAIVERHFGESLACAQAIPTGVQTLLDYGSGGGFPGAVISLVRPEIAVTLAESQGKKAAFLQELCRTLNLTATVHAGRVDALPAHLRFDAATLRAVDKMHAACAEARLRMRAGGWLVILTTAQGLRDTAAELDGIAWRSPLPLATTVQGLIALGRVLAQT